MVIISLLFNATSGLAIRLPLWVWGDYETSNDDSDYSEGKSLAGSLMLILMILMIILTVPPILFFKSRPATPPCFTASDQCKRENYMTAGGFLLKNRDYLILSLTFPFILGTITLFTLQMEYIVKPFDFKLKDISNAVGLGVLAGVIGDVCVGTAIKKTSSYKKVLRICNLLVTLFFGLMIVSLLSETKIFFFLCYFAVCGCSAIMALSFELACELSFPVSENTTIAFFGLFGNLVNFT
jgi:FLVCR family feline leukemia virus subgroup C receptor-related protein